MTSVHCERADTLDAVDEEEVRRSANSAQSSWTRAGDEPVEEGDPAGEYIRGPMGKRAEVSDAAMTEFEASSAHLM